MHYHSILPVSLTNTNDIIASTLSLLDDNDFVYTLTVFYKTDEVIEERIGLPIQSAQYNSETSIK